MLIVPSSVRPSAIHGLGVFADEDIPSGTPVWLNGEYMSELQIDSLNRLSELAARLFERYGYWDIRQQCWKLPIDDSRYMNHSERPSLQLLHDGSYVARYDIKAGEELTCDYREFTIWPPTHKGQRT